MSSESARRVALMLDESRSRIQTVAELLLLSCCPTPVFTRPEDLTDTQETFVRYRDKAIGQLNSMLILTRDIVTQVYTDQISWKQFCARVQDMVLQVINLSELTAHIAYLMAVNMPDSQPAVLGPVASVHQLTSADLDLRFCCSRLKRSRISDLQPLLLVDMCSTITKSLTVMSDICRHAAEEISDANDQDQFKLCVKVITSATGCLVSSIKSFKQTPSEIHLRRVVTFCDPVSSASSALLAFASEKDFIGSPASLSKDGMELYKSVLGLSMNIASATVQICKAVRDLVHSSSTKRHQDRISLCVESISRTAAQLRNELLSHKFGKPLRAAECSGNVIEGYVVVDVNTQPCALDSELLPSKSLREVDPSGKLVRDVDLSEKSVSRGKKDVDNTAASQRSPSDLKNHSAKGKGQRSEDDTRPVVEADSIEQSMKRPLATNADNGDAAVGASSLLTVTSHAALSSSSSAPLSSPSSPSSSSSSPTAATDLSTSSCEHFIYGASPGGSSDRSNNSDLHREDYLPLSLSSSTSSLASTDSQLVFGDRQSLGFVRESSFHLGHLGAQDDESPADVI